MGQRRQGRELALQFLYQQDFLSRPLAEETLERDWQVFCRHFRVAAASRSHALALVRGICRHQEEIDGLLRDRSRHWRMERMPVVDRNILRLAVYEMRCGGEVPGPVAINEALEIARRFGSEESVAFINGILDAVRQEASLPGIVAAP